MSQPFKDLTAKIKAKWSDEAHGVYDCAVEELSHEAARAMVERKTMALLGIGADEYFARWDDGEYAHLDCSDPAWCIGAMYEPFYRTVKR